MQRDIFDGEDSEEARYEKRRAMNAQRIEDYKKEAMHWPEVWLIRCRRRRRFTLRIITTTIRQSGDTMPVP